MITEEKVYKRISFRLIGAMIVLGISVFSSGCFSVRPGSARSGKHLYETFYVGEKGMQYFIKPLAFNNANEKIKLDITFRDKNEITDSATVNISIWSKELFKSADSLKISNKSATIAFKNLDFMFAERSKANYKSRFSTKNSLANVKNIFDSPDWNVLIFRDGEVTKCTPNNKTKKKIKKLRHEIFTLL